MKHLHFQHVVVSLSVALASSAAFGGGIARTWFTGNSGSFNDAVFWDPLGVPGPLDTAIFNVDTNYVVDLDADAGFELLNMSEGDVTLDLDLFTMSVHGVIVGDSAPDVGTLTLEQGVLGVTPLAPPLRVRIGKDAGTSGTLIVAALATFQSSDPVIIGDAGQGALHVVDGGTVSTSVNVLLGDDVGAAGAVLITGPGADWTAAGQMFVGNFGSGTLDVAAGGLLSTVRAKVGDEIGSTGNATVSGAGSAWNDSMDIIIGNSGTGTLNVSSGGHVTTPLMIIGDDPGSSGLIAISAPGGQLATSGQTTVGNSGAGVLRLLGGSASASTYVVNASGRIEGAGTITGPVTNGGVVAPDGTLGVTGTYQQSAAGRLIVTVSCGGADRLSVSGAATLGGTLEVVVDNASPPFAGQQYTVLSASSIAGAFATIQAPPSQSVTVTATGVEITALTGQPGSDADLDGNGTVGIGDLLIMLAQWGPCGACPADLDGSGSVGINDLLDLLAVWGSAGC